MNITHGRYRITFLDGEACATWTDGDKRPRHRLGVMKSDGVAMIRAKLIAFAAKKDAEEVRASANTVGAILDAYAKHRELDGKVMRPILSNIRVLKPFWGEISPFDVSEDLCKEYTRLRIKADCTGSTILTELGRISSALNWAIERNMIPNMTKPPVMWFPQRSEAKQRVLSEDEALALINATTETHTRLFILLALYTGARTGAILELTWDRVDLDNMTVDYRAPRQVDMLKKRKEKGRAKLALDPVLAVELRMAKAVQEAEESDCRYVIQRHGGGR